MAKNEKPAAPAAPAAASAPAEQLLEQSAASTGPVDSAVPSAELAPVLPTDTGPAPSELDDAIPGLWIRSVPPTFRRCGFAFTREGVGIALSALDERQVEQLVSEPNLVVEHTVFTDKARD